MTHTALWGTREVSLTEAQALAFEARGLLVRCSLPHTHGTKMGTVWHPAEPSRPDTNMRGDANWRTICTEVIAADTPRAIGADSQTLRDRLQRAMTERGGAFMASDAVDVVVAWLQAQNTASDLMHEQHETILNLIDAAQEGP